MEDMSLPAAASHEGKPIIIGLFGVPGSGKSTLQKRLAKDDHTSQFMFFEGSEVIESIVSGGLVDFKRLSETEKMSWRVQAIHQISQQCLKGCKMGIIVGHFLFWSENEKAPESVLTPEDWNAFTHILYLGMPAERIKQQIDNDVHRPDRSQQSVEHLRTWQAAEMEGLRSGCLESHAAFRVINAGPEDVLDQTLEYLNQVAIEGRLDSIMSGHGPSKLRTVLLLDGDKTLIPGDTGEAFWMLHNESNPLEEVFEQGYSYKSFREATDLYRAADKAEFEGVSTEVARNASMHLEFLNLLQKMTEQDHVCAIVVTCGLRSIWEKVSNGVSEKVQIIGSEIDGIIVTPDLKGALVDRLKIVHSKFVWAFGDSPVDLPMLQKADQAVVVVGEKDSRSRSMEERLGSAIREGLEARQILMQANKDAPLLDDICLPVVQLCDTTFVHSIFETPRRLLYHDATEKTSAKLLMSSTRDADCKGPALVDAHRLVGRYLATEYLGEVLGLETYKMKHVQGGETDGHRLFSENQTVVVPLMRGGEPMARGVWEAFPTAMYVHAKNPTNLHKNDHVIGRAAIVLVDGVVNTGKSIAEFVKYIRKCDSHVKIVVIAGAVQGKAVEEGGFLERLMNRYGGLSLIALRISGNKYTGRGSTDTGHRLFNTTHME